MKKFSNQPIANKIFMVIMGVILAVYSISLMIPILWTINASLQQNYFYITKPFSLAYPPQFNNYKIAFQNLNVDIWSRNKQVTVRYNILNMFMFSLGYSSLTAFMNVFLPSVVSYALAKYKFRGSDILYKIAIFIMIIPIIGSLPSSLEIRDKLNLYDNFFPFIITAPGAFNFNFLLLYGSFKALPKEYREAAVMDGAGHYTVMLRIYYPMMIPLFTALFMLGFIGSWNDYMTIIIYLPSYPNLAYGVFLYQQNALIMGYSMPQVLAGFLIIAVPTVLIWVASQGVISKRLVVGGLKG